MAAAKADLAQAVQDGRLTAAQQAEILADLPDRIDDLVNGDLGPRGDHGPRGFEGPPSAPRRRLANPPTSPERT